MSYIDTIKIEKLNNKFYVVAGMVEAIVGEKHNFFRLYKDSIVNEYAASAALKENRFPKVANGFDAIEQAEEYKEAFTNYARAVIALPKKYKVGHSCEFWK